MSEKILFMIINNNVQFLENSDMDHREWYQSLGLDINAFDQVVRGYVLEHKIVFFKGLFNYDEEVIKMARMFSPTIREYCHDSSLEVYCGIVVQSYGSKWEPVLKITENEITGIPVQTTNVEKKEKVPVQTAPILEFKNDFNDASFIKRAIIITGIVLVATIIVKIILFSKGEILKVTDFSAWLLALGQVAMLIVVINSYKEKRPYTKYLALLASALIILTLDLWDVLIGILYFVFSVDQNYFKKILNLVSKRNK